jgi:predicted nucleotidyltransferase
LCVATTARIATSIYSWTWTPTVRCWNIVGVDQDLEELLDRRVDVLTGASLHPGLHDRILAESRPL